MKILLKESFDEWQKMINQSDWGHKILICCGHKPTAISIATLFAIDPESKTDHLIGVCTSQSECLELIQQSHDPLLIFISGRLDDGSGISLINAIHDQALSASGEDHITVLTLNTVNPLSLKEAINSSANIILTHRGFETLTIYHVLHSVKEKINYVDPLIHHILDPSHLRKSNLLSKRELNVLELVCDGMTNHEIGSELHIADVTARQHVQAVIRKLHARNRTDSAVKAIREGLVE
ncbi:response regulator transcription factor [Synechococcus sp. UW179A]|uniref:response regulator transcription factor n=1 Tax=Synechococcus sp. UW179A TaxID=2575510 RepID=UPI000E0F3F4C|nr:response regulator transcription factor [Synechococcus sp. UW179A]